jgi:LacI family transcriptional regulator
MRGLEDEIAAHTRHLAAERVEADIRHTDVFDAAKLASALDAIHGYDGVAVVALDHPRVREAVNGLMARGTEVVTLVSDVPGAARAHFRRHRQLRRGPHRGHADGPLPWRTQRQGRHHRGLARAS